LNRTRLRHWLTRNLETGFAQPLPATEPALARELGTVSSIAILAGTVIGTGIFLVPSTMARETGSLSLVFAVWIFGALLSMAGALTYAELGSTFPEAGGEYVFLKKAYGPLWGFLFGWQQIVIGKTGSISAIAIAFSIFLSYLVPQLNLNWIDYSIGRHQFIINGLQVTAIISLFMVTYINCSGVATGGNLQSVLTIIKMSAIFILVAIIFASDQGNWGYFSEATPIQKKGVVEWISSLGAALAAALWAFDGWNNLTMVGGEIKDPHKTIPRVLIYGVVAVASIYIITNISFFFASPFSAVQESQHIAQDIATKVFGINGGLFLSIAALVSTFASLNGSTLSGARVFYAMSKDGFLPVALAKIQYTRRTPTNALITQFFLASSLILIFGRDQQAFERVLDYALFGTWGFYSITAIAVIVLRYRHPEMERPYNTPGYPWVPLLFSLVGLLFCISIAFRRPSETVFGLFLLGMGLPIYLFYRYRKAN